MSEIAEMLSKRRREVIEAKAALRLQIENAKSGLLRLDEELADIAAAERCLLGQNRENGVSLDE